MTGPEKNSEEYSERLKSRSERADLWNKSEGYARRFYELLVTKVGEPKAKEIMRHVMGGKKPGPPMTDDDIALKMLIYTYLLHWGEDQTNAKIAKRIIESKPRYLELKSGAIIFANNDFSETYMSLPDDPIVGSRPIDLKLAAIKKQVERIRRWTIKDGMLPEAYAPRQYRRD